MSPTENAVQDSIALTFAQRGVQVPLTTPSLSGARIRRGIRYALEVLVANPSGGRGQYVLPIEMIDSYCRMTLHDRALKTRVLEAGSVTPASIRRAARDIAAQGFAGRAAAAAAAEADRAEEHERLLVSKSLTATLIRQLDPQAGNGQAIEHLPPDEFDRHMRAAISRVAAELSCTPADIQATLQELATSLAEIGLTDATEHARLPSAVARMRGLHQDLKRWGTPSDRPSADVAQMIAEVARATATLADETIQTMRAEARDVYGLLRRRFSDPEGLAGLLGRPAWLLDGWDQLGLVWRADDTHTPTELRLAEMASNLPLLPREVTAWSRGTVDPDQLDKRNRGVTLNMDWRTASPVFDLVARNERQRALAA